MPASSRVYGCLLKDVFTGSGFSHRDELLRFCLWSNQQACQQFPAQTMPALTLQRLSGKSYTMFGEGASLGIISFAADELFSLIQQRSLTESRAYKVEVQFIEVYVTCARFFCNHCFFLLSCAKLSLTICSEGTKMSSKTS
jgi:hypothetical protein